MIKSNEVSKALLIIYWATAAVPLLSPVTRRILCGYKSGLQRGPL